jgi:hypothetical protein
MVRVDVGGWDHSYYGEAIIRSNGITITMVRVVVGGWEVLISKL